MTGIIYETATVLDFLQTVFNFNSTPIGDRAGRPNTNIIQVSFNKGEWNSLLHLKELNYMDLGELVAIDEASNSKGMYRNIQIYWDGSDDTDIDLSDYWSGLEARRNDGRIEAGGGERVVRRVPYPDPVPQYYGIPVLNDVNANQAANTLGRF